MATKKKKRSGITRSQVVTVRLDPKLRYMAELVARKQRRTLSSYIEWLIQKSMSEFYIDEGTDRFRNDATTFADEAENLWDVLEPDRFAKLALRYPELLNYSEQIRWKYICETGFFWRGRNNNDEWSWDIEEENLIFERLRKHWALICAIADGEEDPSKLKDLEKLPKLKAHSPVGKVSLTEDVPF